MMMTLQEAITQYGTRTTLPVVDDQVLFERGQDYVGCSINLGKVTKVQAGGRHAETTVMIRGIHTFFPDGRHERFRGVMQWRFPASHFMRPIGERVLTHAQRWEELAGQTRDWVATIGG